MIPSWYPINRTIVSFKEKKSVNTLNKDHLTPSDKDIKKAKKRAKIKDKEVKGLLKDVLDSAFYRNLVKFNPSTSLFEYTLDQTDVVQDLYDAGFTAGTVIQTRIEPKFRKLRVYSK